MTDKYTADECSKILELLSMAHDLIRKAENIIREDPNRGAYIVDSPHTGLCCAANRIGDVYREIEGAHYEALKREGKI